MGLVLILIVLILVFGIGGFAAPAPGARNILWVIAVTLLIWLILSRVL